MSDLFEKISTLVNAQLHDLLGRNPRSPLARIKLNAQEAERNPQRSASGLRQRLEEAIEYEDQLQANIDGRMREVVELDKLVDEMLRSGDRLSAQRLQGQLNMKRQQLTIAESELHDHRLLTRHLMQELSALETALHSQARGASGHSGRRAASGGRRRIPLDGAATAGGSANKSVLNAMTEKFEETRANLESLLGNAPEPAPPERSNRFQKFEIIDEAPDPRRPKPRKHDGPDMSDRLSRLSKPSEDGD